MSSNASGSNGGVSPPILLAAASLSRGAVAGLVIGCFFGLVVLAVSVYYLCMRQGVRGRPSWWIHTKEERDSGNADVDMNGDSVGVDGRGMTGSMLRIFSQGLSSLSPSSRFRVRNHADDAMMMEAYGTSSSILSPLGISVGTLTDDKESSANYDTERAQSQIAALGLEATQPLPSTDYLNQDEEEYDTGGDYHAQYDEYEYDEDDATHAYAPAHGGNTMSGETRVIMVGHGHEHDAEQEDEDDEEAQRYDEDNNDAEYEEEVDDSIDTDIGNVDDVEEQKQDDIATGPSPIPPTSAPRIQQYIQR